MGQAKRLIASRKLKRRCDHCNRSFAKGDIYYHTRKVFVEGDEVFADNYTTCPRCKYKQQDHMLRYGQFITVGCKHPERFIETQYRYMTGEAVMEPSHDECRLCQSIV